MAFQADDADDIFDTLATEFLNEEPDANPRADPTLVNSALVTLAQTLATNQEEDLKLVYDSAYVEDATGEELTKKARNLGVTRDEAVKATGVAKFSRDSNATTDYTIAEGTIVETVEDDPVQFETTETVTLSQGTKSVNANVQARQGGADGNVGANAIGAMPSPPTGVDEVTNPNATGDPTNTDTNGDPLITGEDEESDDDLRARVLDTDAVTEGPSPDGLDLALTETDGVLSVKVNTNQTGSTVNGLDPYHSEVVVYGGKTQDIADTLFDTMAVGSLLRLQGGINGSKNSATVHSDLLDQDITVPITRPTEVTLDVTIGVVHTSTYDGDEAVKDEMVDYVGGTLTDGSSTNGLVNGENLQVNELEGRVEGVKGVDYANTTLVDEDNDSNDDTTTDSDGVPVLTVSNNEVARLDASSITVNTTAR